MKAAHWFTSLALLTASCDLILAFNLVGNVRFCQLMQVGIIFCALAKMLQVRAVLWPRGGYAIAIWSICQGLLIAESPAPMGSTVFFCFLLFTIIAIYAILQIYGRSLMLGSLMKVYLLSFVIVAAFGGAQFVSPALHLGHPLIGQWIVHGLIPRINGFSYEPSYFATYLVIGWVMLIDLRVSKAQITQQRRWYWYLLLVSAVLFLSTSKTAWLLMAGEGIARLAPSIWRLFRQQATRLRVGSLVFPLPRFKAVIWTCILAAATIAFLAAVNQVVPLNRFLAGSGLNGTAAHSINDRMAGLGVTMEVIRQHFWVGRSLGGVPATIAEMTGHHAQTVAELKTFWGFPVPFEVFAASGFWAFLPFVWFFVAITRGESRLIRAHWSDERAKWLHAVVRALVFEWLALCSDQNVLRAYLWLHVAVVVAVGYNLRYFKDGAILPNGLVAA